MQIIVEGGKRRLVCDCGNNDMEEMEYVSLLPIVQQFVGEPKPNTEPADATALFVSSHFEEDGSSNKPEIIAEFEMIRCKACRHIFPVPEKVYIYQQGV